MSGAVTNAVVLVWASQCIAFIRYRGWFAFSFLLTLMHTFLFIYCTIVTTCLERVSNGKILGFGNTKTIFLQAMPSLTIIIVMKLLDRLTVTLDLLKGPRL
jgi:hypothetical protein